MRTPGVEQRPEWTKAEDRRETRQKGIQRRGNIERERERRGPGGGRNLRAPPFRMQIQEHLEAKVACKSALCSHLIGARAAAPRANTCFLQPLKNRVAYFSLFFSSLSLSLFFRPSFAHPLFVFPPSPQPFRPAIALYRLTISGNTDRPEYIFTRIARRSGTLFADKRNDFHGKYQTGPVYRGWKRERERGKKTTAEAQFIKFFPLAWFETPLPKHRHSSTTTITINSRACLSGRGGKGGKGKKSASTVKTTNPIPGPRIDHRDD